MKISIRGLTRRSFVRNVAVVASGTAASQAITMAFAPIITRLYGPEIYGVQGVFIALVGVMSTLAALSYPVAIVLPKNDTDAIGLARLSVYIGVFVSLASLGALVLFGSELLALLNAEKISAFVYLIPLAMFVSVLSGVTSQWLIRKKSFALTSKISVLVALLTNSTKMGFGYFYPNALVLIVSNILSGLLSATLMIVGWKRSISKHGFVPQSNKPSASSWELAKEHYDFALYRTPQNMINAASQSMPVIMLSSYFGASSVGFYAIALSVLGMPAGLVGNSVMQVFYPRVNEAIRDGQNAKRLIMKTTIAMAVTGALPFVLIIIAGPDLFAYVFGEGWRTAGVYAQWLSPWLFFQFINKPAVSAIPALNLQGGLLIYEIFSTGTKIVALYIGYLLFKSDVVAIALFSIFGVAAYVWLIYWVVKRSEEQRGVSIIGDGV